MNDCERCNAELAAQMDTYCGAYVCQNCYHHQGLARCYCGWSTSGDDGAAELVEMGETL